MTVVSRPIQEETVEDINDEFDRLTAPEETITDGIVESVDVNAEFEALTEGTPIIEGSREESAQAFTDAMFALASEGMDAIEDPADLVGSPSVEAPHPDPVSFTEESADYEDSEDSEDYEDYEDDEDEESDGEVLEEAPLSIPTTNATSTLDDTESRFSGASWFARMQGTNISIIGQGGIGSWATLIVSRLGVDHITTYDGDTVESVNMAGQMFGRRDIGSSKVSAVYHRVADLCDRAYVNSRPHNFAPSDFLEEVTIGALDNMEARKQVYNKWKHLHCGKNSALFIDGRLSADELQIFAIRGDQRDRMKIYEDKWLFDQSEGEHTQCSFKQTTYMATMIGSLIANVLVNHTANMVNPDAMYDFPFFINYNAEMMYFKTTEE